MLDFQQTRENLYFTLDYTQLVSSTTQHWTTSLALNSCTLHAGSFCHCDTLITLIPVLALRGDEAWCFARCAPRYGDNSGPDSDHLLSQLLLSCLPFTFIHLHLPTDFHSYAFIFLAEILDSRFIYSANLWTNSQTRFSFYDSRVIDALLNIHTDDPDGEWEYICVDINCKDISCA